MKYKRVLSSVLAFIMILSLNICVHANESQSICEYTYDGTKVNITGSTEASTRVLLLVTDPDSDICYFDQQTGVNGVYDFEYIFPADADATEYTFTVSEMDTTTMTQTQTSFYVCKIDDKYDYMVNSFALSGTIDAGDIKGEAVITNTSEDTMKAPVLITAVYEKETNRMVSATVSVTDDIAAGKQGTVTVNNPFTASAENAANYYVQAFLWEDMSTMRPILTKIIK